MFLTYPFCQMNFDDKRVNTNDDINLSVDCTDCKVPQKCRDFSSYKFALKSGLRYEVAVGIVTGEMKWINGLFPCGKYPDVKIFRASLLTCLGDFERVEADDGYGTSERAHSGLKGYGTKGHVSEAGAYQKSADLFLTDTLFLANNLINSAICEDRLICKSVLFLHGK